jgi:filamentous hemagglutinin family protein
LSIFEHNSMKQCDCLPWIVSGITLAYLTMTSPLQAQIVPDATLPENSSATPQGNTEIINGGTRAGSNLFHSFEQFSVPTNSTAYFNNALEIQNIISRVTGESVSEIDGTLRANGAANLFLLNPNGIIFGPKASLDIGGSFLASTASSLKFTDGKEFSATEPQTTSLLTVSVPVGLQFGAAPGSIRNQSQVKSDDPTDYFFPYPVGLQVQPGKTLALVGSDVALEGGNLTAEGGQIELGSVASNSLVSLNPTDSGWSLGYKGVQSFQDIQLSQEAFVDASGEGSGNIQVQGRRVTLTDSSGISADTVGALPGGEVSLRTDQLSVQNGAYILTITSGAGQGGDLTVTASESVELDGTSADGFISSGLFAQVRKGAKGPGGNLTIETRRLLVRDGARVSTTTFGARQGGDLAVTASESVELDGTSADGFISSGLFARTEGSEAAGDLTIKTGRLLVRDGARVSTETLGAGQGGDLTVTASESVELVDVARKPDGEPFTDKLDRPFLSGLYAQTQKKATGAGGKLSIFTKKLTVRDGAQANSTTLGTKNAGDLTVQASEVELVGAALSADGGLLTENGLPFPSGLFAGTDIGSEGDGGTLTVETDRLSLRDGAVLQTSTLGAGNAGNLTVQASESVELIGTAKGIRFPTGLLAVSGGIPGFPNFVDATGQGGDLKITTGNLLVQGGAAIAVSSINPNNNAKGAGNITVAAPTISLDDGAITATTASGKGGDIAIQVPNLLLLGRDSNISTTAGTAGTGGDGGNITVDTNFIVAVPQENSDIVANAFSGSGGEVNIQVQGGIFGLQPRSRQELQNLLQPDDPLDPKRLPSNDITAISQTNPSLSGQVIINTPDVDPSEGVVTLPDVPVNVEVAQGCQTGAKQASVEFFNTGKGGLAPSPYEPLSSSEIWEDVPRAKNAGAARAAASPATPPEKIVEAQGWLINEKGEAVLVAEVPTTRFHRCRLR